jgi:hypothetical protein
MNSEKAADQVELRTNPRAMKEKTLSPCCSSIFDADSFDVLVYSILKAFGILLPEDPPPSANPDSCSEWAVYNLCLAVDLIDEVSPWLDVDRYPGLRCSAGELRMWRVEEAFNSRVQIYQQSVWPSLTTDDVALRLSRLSWLQASLMTRHKLDRSRFHQVLRAVKTVLRLETGDPVTRPCFVSLAEDRYLMESEPIPGTISTSS